MTQQISKREYFESQKKAISNGLRFASISSASILISGRKKQTMFIESKKEEVLNFIREKRTVSLTNIMKRFNLDVIQTKSILKQLEKNGKISLD